ncbi:hypothetical protein [Streptosporangium sp. NPDC087985]|uniref:hypothetical protein n=1 Tax=Streptosporangium sp. NPDC087985 TaxID=3366196 RepID=UPI0038245073
MQTVDGTRAAPPLLASFEGEGYQMKAANGDTVTSGFTNPPDENIAVGPTQVLETVNAKMAVFDKRTGRTLYGPVNNNSWFAGFGGSCEQRNSGDAVVRYDQLAQRWVIVLPTFQPAAGPFFMCYLVSKTSDALGEYYRYAFQSPAFPDYPVLGVWPDGYYTTQSSGDDGNERISCVVDRTKMLVGDTTATMQCMTVDPAQFLLPADLDGYTLPPIGAPNIQVATGGRQLSGVLGNDGLYAYKFHVDWDNPANSTYMPINFHDPRNSEFPPGVGGAGSLGPPELNPHNKLWVEPYVYAGGGQLVQAVPQPGVTQKLDTQGDKLMRRMKYRNFGDHESLTLLHSVNSPAGTSADRWYELRLQNGDPVLHQQGTYAPDTDNHRFMGSIAMDRRGNIAMGHAISGSNTFPGVRFTSRLAGDPLNHMTQHEGVIKDGISVRTGTGSQYRYGDYTSMELDPADDCTFWYVGQYYKVSGQSWSTWIGSFRLPTCRFDAGGETLHGIEGSAVSGKIANVTDAVSDSTPSDLTASIDWGDGSKPSVGTVSGGNGKFSVSGSHVYAEEGTFQATVSIAAEDGSEASVTSTVVVADAPLAATGAAPALSTQELSGTVATFTDGNRLADPSDFTATVDWGDGSSSPGTVTGGEGNFKVAAAHTYTGTGNFTITTSVHDRGGSTGSASSTTLIYDFAPGGGAFVVGDESASNSVTYWGAQWAKANLLSGGSAPASFKGYANAPANPDHGTNWRSDPGNGSNPPKGPLPDYMGVIVSSSISKTGSAISGDTAHIIVVKTDAGYDGDAGHPGTGSVVATVR